MSLVRHLRRLITTTPGRILFLLACGVAGGFFVFLDGGDRQDVITQLLLFIAIGIAINWPRYIALGVSVMLAFAAGVVVYVNGGMAYAPVVLVVWPVAGFALMRAIDSAKGRAQPHAGER